MFCHICGAEIKEVIVCDIVLVDGKYHYEEVVSPILFSDEFNMRTGKIFDYDFFKKAIAKKYLCTPEDVQSKYIDEIEIPAAVCVQLDKKEKDLGCRCPVCEDFM
ncbi:MAG TPA: hypothetical protein PLU43_07120 [Lachnospiraceae bacterium]|nr:hypothetical protein [Lachnospiraceae bacterium]